MLEQLSSLTGEPQGKYSEIWKSALDQEESSKKFKLVNYVYQIQEKVRPSILQCKNILKEYLLWWKLITL